jgi:peptide/nickel transport system permease protein
MRLVKQLWQIIRGDRLALTGFILLVGIVLVALCAPLIATHNPNATNERVAGVIVPYVDNQWQDIEFVGDASLNGVALGGDSGVAVGFDGESTLLRNGEWNDADTGVSVSLRAVDTAGEVTMAVGDGGTILMLDGGEWATLDSGTDRDLFGVALSSPSHGLAVGASGTILRWDGQTWSELDVLIGRDLNATTLVDDQHGYVVGERGTLLAYDGNGFESIEGLTFRDLFGVDALDAGMVLAVGERGTILSSGDADEGWHEMRGPESRDLRDVRFLAPGSAITIGTHGVAMRLIDGSWITEETGFEQTLRGLASHEGDLVAVGTDPFVDRLAAPSGDHFFGTTHLGRDIFSQTIVGSQTALLVGFLAAAMVVLIGVNVGLIAGYFKGRSGSLLMRFVDVMYALPFEPFALVLVLIFRPSLTIIILAIGLLTWRTTARIVRAQVLTLSERPFVKAARVAGSSDWKILYVHIAPNVLPLAFLQLAVAMAFAITAEATLSFLGLGPPGLHSWGSILHEARLSGAWRTAWWWVIPPGLFIMVTVVSTFFIARALEILTNPRLAARS